MARKAYGVPVQHHKTVIHIAKKTTKIDISNVGSVTNGFAVLDINECRIKRPIKFSPKIYVSVFYDGKVALSKV